jgi:hemoglobin
MNAGTLYERLGGVFRIAEIVNYFSDRVVENPVAGQTSKNPRLQKWHTQDLDRLPGLKFMRTLWVCALAGGPFDYLPTRAGQTEFGLEEAHRELTIAPDEFDEVAAELERALDNFNVPSQEKSEVMAGFFAHKYEVTTGYRAGVAGQQTMRDESMGAADRDGVAASGETTSKQTAAPVVGQEGTLGRKETLADVIEEERRLGASEEAEGLKAALEDDRET